MQVSNLSLALATASGMFDIGFALFHLLFWRIFAWPRTIAPSGGINSAISQTLNVMLIYCFVLYGGWLIWASLGREPPHPYLLAAGCGFWLLRALLQPLLFGSRSRMFIMFTFIFLLGSALHLLPVLV